MKIKSDFITNSSSSNYIMVGFIISEKELFEKLGINDDTGDWYDVLDDFIDDREIMYTHTNQIGNRNFKIGYQLARTDDSGLFIDELSYDLDEIKENPNVKRLIEKLNYTGKVKIFIGVEEC